jgi:rubrerythrin
MAQTGSLSKDKILAEFETMKSFELSAKDLYARIAADPNVRQKKIRDTFALIAKDEQQHAESVQEIIDIVRETL